jgi:tetratricopeptide (TPR) repeat protein
VTGELLDHHPECLLPVLVLHLELQDRYQQIGDTDPFLLESTRARTRALAQVYAEEAGSELASRLAALALVELAAALEQGQQRISALVALREALALDAANPDVLLALAFHFESQGFEREAVAALERLLEVEPRSGEGRLRLAMHHLRASRQDEAAALLGRLLRDGGSDWVLAVGYQELGRLLLQRGRIDEAVRVLREGVGRLPRVQRLYLELAYALDRAGRPADAREIARQVAALLPEAGDRPSPRLRYRVPAGTPGAERDRRSRDALLRHATARLPLLSRALAASAGEAGR